MRSRRADVELVVDLLVPAGLPSRYRARLVAFTAREVTLELAFCPSIFRSGLCDESAAEIALLTGLEAARWVGRFRVEGARTSSIAARFRFARPLLPREVALLVRTGAAGEMSLGSACAFGLAAGDAGSTEMPSDASPVTLH